MPGSHASFTGRTPVVMQFGRMLILARGSMKSSGSAPEPVARKPLVSFADIQEVLCMLPMLDLMNTTIASAVRDGLAR